jgi:hypothetical protein
MGPTPKEETSGEIELGDLELDSDDGPAMPCAPSRARALVDEALRELGKRGEECEILRSEDLSGAPCAAQRTANFGSTHRGVG